MMPSAENCLEELFKCPANVVIQPDVTHNATEYLNMLTGIIIDTACGIHTRLGPGLLESVYEVLLARNLVKRGLRVERQKSIICTLDGIVFDEPFRPDIIVNECVIVEVKAVEKLAYVFERQLLTYLKALDFRVGLLLNFGAPTMREGIRRMVYKL